MDIQPIHEMLLKDKPLPAELSIESEEVWQRLLQELIDLKGQACLEQIIRYLKSGESFQTVGQARWERFLARTMLSVKELPIDIFERMAVRYLEAGLHIAENRGAFFAEDKAEEDFFSRLYEAKQIEISYEESKTKGKLEKIKVLFPHVAKIVQIGEQKGIFCFEKKKIAFFVKPGMDSFLGDIMSSLQSDYIVKKYIVTESKQIDEGMEWADVCWFEWCDELIIYGSQSELASQKIMICRLHRYEAFSEYPKKVSWNAVNKVVFVSEHIQDVFLKKVKIEQEKCCVIYNGINMDKFQYQKREKGYNLAWIGYLNLRKNPMLLLQFFSELVKADPQYQLHFAGEFQEEILFYYLNDMIKQMNLENNIHFYGHIPNNKVADWLKDKHYIVSSSIAEGHPVGIMEAMSSGLKPVLHYFPGIENFYPSSYIFRDKHEFCRIIREEKYDPAEYSEYIARNFSLKNQARNIKGLFEEALCSKVERKKNDKNIICNDLEKDIERVFHQLRENANERLHENIFKDVSLILPTYNRADLLLEDLKKGFKFGDVPKIIIDDFSDEKFKYHLDSIENKYGVYKIVRQMKNSGVALAMQTGLNFINTNHVISLDDDDMLFCLNENEMEKEFSSFYLEDDSLILLPKYILNLEENGNISLGYDRSRFHLQSASAVLREFAHTGEMSAFNAGACYKVKSLQPVTIENIFEICEDFVRVARVCGNNPNGKIIVSSNFIYLRRISNSSLSKKITPKKLAVSLYAMVIACFYGMKNGVISIAEVVEAIQKRGLLLQKLHGFGEQFSKVLVDYLFGKIDRKTLCEKNGIHIKEKELMEIFALKKYFEKY